MGVSLVYYLMDAACLLKGLGMKVLGSIMLMSLGFKSGQHQFSPNNYQYGITTKGYKNW